MDHDALQRTLFRMQCDERFAARVRQGEATALASTGLVDDELALLMSASPAGLRADPKGERRGQVLGNLATEFVLSAATASAAGTDDFLDAFLASDEFHAAMAAGERLPLAFGAYAERRALDVSSASFGGLVALERAMSRVRRAAAGAPELAPGEVVLQPGAELVRIVAGLVAYADELRVRLNAGSPLRAFRPLQGCELVLIAPRPGTTEFALGEVHVELCQPPVGDVLERAREPLSLAERAVLAARFGASPEDLEAFVDELVADGLLARGRAPVARG